MLEGIDPTTYENVGVRGGHPPVIGGFTVFPCSATLRHQAFAAVNAPGPGQFLRWRQHAVYRFQIHLSTDVRVGLREFDDQPNVCPVSAAAERNRSIPNRIRTWMLFDVKDLGDNA